jgi:hypothetical protein
MARYGSLTATRGTWQHAMASRNAPRPQRKSSVHSANLPLRPLSYRPKPAPLARGVVRSPRWQDCHAHSPLVPVEYLGAGRALAVYLESEYPRLSGPGTSVTFAAARLSFERITLFTYSCRRVLYPSLTV